MSEIESCITSFVDGRVRLRHPSLKRAEDAELVRGFLASLPGILRVTVNSRTGSLLLEYDPDQISREDLLALKVIIKELFDDCDKAFKKLESEF